MLKAPRLPYESNTLTHSYYEAYRERRRAPRANGGTSEGRHGWKWRRRLSCFVLWMRANRILSRSRRNNFCSTNCRAICCAWRYMGEYRKPPRGICSLRWEWENQMPEFGTSVFVIPGEKMKNTGWRSARERAADAWKRAHGTVAPEGFRRLPRRSFRRLCYLCRSSIHRTSSGVSTPSISRLNTRPSPLRANTHCSCKSGLGLIS
jgi:hypothetical protein